MPPSLLFHVRGGARQAGGSPCQCRAASISRTACARAALSSDRLFRSSSHTAHSCSSRSTVLNVSAGEREAAWPLDTPHAYLVWQFRSAWKPITGEFSLFPGIANKWQFSLSCVVSMCFCFIYHLVFTVWVFIPLPQLDFRYLLNLYAYVCIFF